MIMQYDFNLMHTWACRYYWFFMKRHITGLNWVTVYSAYKLPIHISKCKNDKYPKQTDSYAKMSSGDSCYTYVKLTFMSSHCV